MKPNNSLQKVIVCALSTSVLIFSLAAAPFAQQARSGKVELGSETAKNGFRNEDEIKGKIENWTTDTDARAWLDTLGFKPAEISSVSVVKPQGEKADVEVTVKTKMGTRTEGISIKLVSRSAGFNQIDKRWLSHYSSMWRMPDDVLRALKLFVGEITPVRRGRAANRMFLNELDDDLQRAVVRFFEANKRDIVSDLMQGDGPHAARWMLVALKATPNTRWAIKPIDQVIKFYSEGPVKITSGGNLRIGRITMQRKGGDGGRDTAKMLQFKIDPSLMIGN